MVDKKQFVFTLLAGVLLLDVMNVSLMILFALDSDVEINVEKKAQSGETLSKQQMEAKTGKKEEKHAAPSH